MKDSQDILRKIAADLAAIESELPQLHDKLSALETRRDHLRITQAVLVGLNDEMPRKSAEPLATKAKEASSNMTARFFQSEGQTTKLVRFLYAKGAGSTVLEAARHTGVSARRTRTAFDRLESRGMMIRSGGKYALTPRGIAAWQSSRVFGKVAVNA